MKFPEQVFVHIETDGKDQFLAADATIAGGVKEGEMLDVATYQLVRVSRVQWERKPAVTPIKGKRGRQS
jgi:hypothetical protein